jgi:hypothetical protein
MEVQSMLFLEEVYGEGHIVGG